MQYCISTNLPHHTVRLPELATMEWVRESNVLMPVSTCSGTVSYWQKPHKHVEGRNRFLPSWAAVAVIEVLRSTINQDLEEQ